MKHHLPVTLILFTAMALSLLPLYTLFAPLTCQETVSEYVAIAGLFFLFSGLTILMVGRHRNISPSPSQALAWLLAPGSTQETAGLFRGYKKWGLTVIVGAAVFSYSAVHLAADASKWEIGKDTRSYMDVSFNDPWNSYRTPGFKYYLTALGQFEPIQRVLWPDLPSLEQYTQNALADEKSCQAFLFVSRANFLLRVAALALLSVALSLHVSAPLAVAAPCLIPHLTELLETFWIMPDQLGATLLLIAVSLGLFFAHSRRLIFLLTLAVISAYAFLVRPAMIFAPALAGVIILLVMVEACRLKQKMRAGLALAIGLLLVMGTAIWPWRLYSKSGLFVVSQIQVSAMISRALYLLQPGDENLFAEERDRQYVVKLLERKPEFDRKLQEKIFPKGRGNYSKIYGLIGCLDEYYYRGFFHDLYRETYFEELRKHNRNLLGEAELAKIVARPIIKAHLGENLAMAGRNALSSLYFYPDVRVSPFGNNIHRLGINAKLVPGIFLSFLLVLAASIAAGTASLRLPVLFIGAIHILAVAVLSFGHAVVYRYLQLSEWCLLLAVFLAIVSLLNRFGALTIRHRA
ncbi:MAG: hypothetical protein FWF99_06430 [Desulfovibrionaceae bacterium]|nr:hypothetical protein [Desulfovibrionaceae bacterium]